MYFLYHKREIPSFGFFFLVQGLGFEISLTRILGLGFWVSGFGFRI